MRLAMSEADLYRKQRVAIETIADAIVEMEKQARGETAAPVESMAVQNTAAVKDAATENQFMAADNAVPQSLKNHKQGGFNGE